MLDSSPIATISPRFLTLFQSPGRLFGTEQLTSKKPHVVQEKMGKPFFKRIQQGSLLIGIIHTVGEISDLILMRPIGILRKWSRLLRII